MAAARWSSRITALFLTIDLTFFGANVLKIAQGGWLPLAIGAVIFTLMTTWKTGRGVVAERLAARSEPLDHFLARIAENPPARVPGTAVFMTAQPRGTPPALTHNLRYNKVLHEHVVTLRVKTMPWPHVPIDERVSVRSLGAGIHEVTAVLRLHGGRRRAGRPALRPARGPAHRRRRHDVFPGAGDPHRHARRPGWRRGASTCSC